MSNVRIKLMLTVVRPILLVLALVIMLLIFAAKWSFTPARNDASLPDAAVGYLNSTSPTEVLYSEGYLEYAGQTLHYAEAGKGETILFLHGFPSYWFSFTRQMSALQKDYRVVAIDGLGAGKSDGPLDADAYRLENMAAHLDSLIDHLGTDKVHLVGHDWGSAFAFGFAQRHPERVLSVTGISAPSPNVMLGALQSGSKFREMAGYIEKLKQANPLLIVALGADKQVWEGAYEPLVAKGLLSKEEGELFREATGNPKRIDAHINWYRANIPEPDAIDNNSFWPSRDARIAVPAQLIWGADDKVFAKEYAEMMLAVSNDIELLELYGVGHWPHVEQPKTVTDAIVELVSRHSSQEQ